MTTIIEKSNDDILELGRIRNMFNGAEVSRVNLDDLELYAGTQQRIKPNTEAMESYQEAMEDGEAVNFPPLRVVRLTEAVTLEDDCTLEVGALILADGFTRCGAAEKAGIESFQVEIVDGTHKDAVSYSYIANSTHGSKLDNKDYQALIRKIYLDNPSIKKGYLARSLGCSAKTVSKALGVVEDEFKLKARTMMDSGYSDKEIAAAVHKSEISVQRWRDAYEEEKKLPEPEPKQINPMKMRFEDVLALDELDKQINLLDMLQTRVDENKRNAGITVPEETTEEAPQVTTEEQLPLPEDDSMPWIEEDTQGATEGVSPLSEYEEFDGEAPVSSQVSIEEADFEEVELPNTSSSHTCWEILGRDKEQVKGLANPKASLKRSLRTAITEVGEEQATAAYEEALAELNA